MSVVGRLCLRAASVVRGAASSSTHRLPGLTTAPTTTITRAIPKLSWHRPIAGVRVFSGTVPKADKKTVRVIFKMRDGQTHEVDAKVGDNLLDIIIENDVDIDGFGACEGTLACSTCHLIFTQEDFDIIPDKPTDEELDMLDLAYGLSDTSRLGCQVIVTKDMDGLVVQVPSGVSDARGAPL